MVTPRMFLLLVLLTAVGAWADTPALQEYRKPLELDPLPEGMATLYRVPWRANQRTVPAVDALAGIGLYYKHIPGNWSLPQHIALMQQLAAAGVRRVRLAPHYAIYLTKDWQAPRDNELAELRLELQASHAAGLRPNVIFVHIPPLGKAGTRELQDWWRQGELMPAGEVGSPEFQAYQNKTYEALKFILNEAKAAGFTAPHSYDLEMGQGLWWGAPAVPRPLPGTTLQDLKPGGRIYEFDRGLIQRLRQDGYQEPLVWWAQTHHYFGQASDLEVPPEAAGRAISFYGAWTGVTTDGWLENTQYQKPSGPGDTWPLRGPLTFSEMPAPRMILARPEGWMADRTRHDNLIELMKISRTPIAMTSIGTVPGDIPDAAAGGLSGWQIKSRALTRSLAFWLNQGAEYVLLHSAYEPGAPQGGEMAHSLLPGPLEPGKFKWENAPPLVALHAFAEVLTGAKAVEKPVDLQFRYRLDPDPEIIPASGAHPALLASDAVALLPFQLDATHFAVAAYVVTPNITRPLEPLQLTLEIDQRITAAHTLHPTSLTHGRPRVVSHRKNLTTLEFPVRDDVTWLSFTVK